MATPLSTLATSYVLSQDEMLGLVKLAGNRANGFLKAMAPLETSPNTVPTPISAYAGTYGLAAGGLVPVMNALGPRQASVMEAMYLLRA